jgi:hypothetical protein
VFLIQNVQLILIFLPKSTTTHSKANFFDSASTASGVFIKRSSRASPNFDSRTLLPFFESRFAKQSLIPSRQTRDTAHQSQSQLAFLSIEFRIAADCALDLFFCLVLLILTVRSATSSSPPHPQSRCLPDSISLSTRSYPLNDDLPVVAEADVFIALRPPLPRQPVVLRKTPSMPRVLSRIFLQDRRAQVVKARF